MTTRPTTHRRWQNSGRVQSHAEIPAFSFGNWRGFSSAVRLSMWVWQLFVTWYEWVIDKPSWRDIREDVLYVQCAVARRLHRIDDVDVREDDGSVHTDGRADAYVLPTAFGQVFVERQVVGAVERVDENDAEEHCAFALYAGLETQTDGRRLELALRAEIDTARPRAFAEIECHA